MFATELSDHDGDTVDDASVVVVDPGDAFVTSASDGVASLRNVGLLVVPSVGDTSGGDLTATKEGGYVVSAAALTTTGPWMAYTSCAPFTSTVSLSTIVENSFKTAKTMTGGPQTLMDRL